jgi:hypothetical protein
MIFFLGTCAIAISNTKCFPYTITLRAGSTTLCDKVCQWLMAGRWFFSRSSTFLHQ